MQFSLLYGSSARVSVLPSHHAILNTTHLRPKAIPLQQPTSAFGVRLAKFLDSVSLSMVGGKRRLGMDTKTDLSSSAAQTPSVTSFLKSQRVFHEVYQLINR